VKKKSIKKEINKSESSYDKPIKQKNIKKEIKREFKIKPESPIMLILKTNNEVSSNPETEIEKEKKNIVRQSHKRNISALSNLSLSPLPLLKEILNPSGNNDVLEKTAFTMKLRTKKKKKRGRERK
jgi:hypothetical protein